MSKHRDTNTKGRSTKNWNAWSTFWVSSFGFFSIVSICEALKLFV